MTMFRLLLEGHDARGQFLVTYDVAADNKDTAVARVTAVARSEGWTVVVLDDCEILGPSENDEIFAATGRAYFG